MARLAVTDYLQNHCFWLMDVGLLGATGLPLLNPMLGFSAISSPSMSVETLPIREGNWFLERAVVKRGATAPITLSRGVSFFDSDFYKWVVGALSGGTTFGTGLTYRRDLLLIHFFARDPTGLINQAKTAVETGVNTAFGQSTTPRNFGPFEFAIRVPAKAYLLKSCIPTQWDSGTGFDAGDGSVSIASLTFTYEVVEEVSLAGSLNSYVPG